MNKIKLGKHKISEQELYDRILVRVPFKQYTRIMDKLEMKIAEMVIDQLPKGQFSSLIKKIKKDLDKEENI